MNKFISTEDLYKLFISCNQLISTDTRNLELNSLFFALKGDNFNANLFANSAIEKGCKYAIVDDETISNGISILLVENALESLQNLAKYHRTKLQIPIIGITGSNGKTTNKELIHAVLSKKYNTYATKGNLNNHIGVPLTLLKINTTHEIAIVEMGANHQGEISFLSNIAQPTYGLITNIGKAHLEGFGGVEGIKKGKSELYKYLKENNGKIFINGNDSTLIELADDIPKIYYGENSEFDIYGKLFPTNEFVDFKWAKKEEELINKPIIKSHLFGHYNFINLLCATCIGNYFGVEEKQINEAISNYLPEMNRSQVKQTKNNTLILDAYNANPSSMQLAINHFSKQTLQNKIVILGDMFELGEYSAKEHEAILDALGLNKDIKCILIGENFFEFEKKYLGFSFYKTINEAIAFLKDNQLMHNTILIKGSRGIKLEKLVDYL